MAVKTKVLVPVFGISGICLYPGLYIHIVLLCLPVFYYQIPTTKDTIHVDRSINTKTQRVISLHAQSLAPDNKTMYRP